MYIGSVSLSVPNQFPASQEMYVVRAYVKQLDSGIKGSFGYNGARSTRGQTASTNVYQARSQSAANRGYET